MQFEKQREATLLVLRDHHMSEARLAVWLQILPSLGESFYKIEETVDFGLPAALVAAIELAVFRDRDGERQQLQLQFWQATLEVEGKGDPIQFHRYVLLAGRKLALLNNEAVRDADMKAVFIKGLPDDIFLGFKTGLHNNPASCKTFDDVFQILKVFAGSDSAKPKINDLIKLRARQYNKSGPAGVFVARAVPKATAAAQSPTTRAVCFDFSKGRCTRGADCKFLHSTAPTPAAVTCTHCLKKGHLVDMCFAKYPEKRTLRPKAPSARSIPSVPRSKAATNLLLTLQESVNKLLLGDLSNSQDEEETAGFHYHCGFL